MKLFLKNLLFTLLVPGTFAVYLPLWLTWGRPAAAEAWIIASAVCVLAIGASIFAWCIWDFAMFGRGTPLPLDAPKKLVVRGLYRYTRNPMYVGVLSVVMGWSILFRAPILLIYAGCMATIFHLFILHYEEPHLRRLFGAEYERYTARVGRWWPRFSSDPL